MALRIPGRVWVAFLVAPLVAVVALAASAAVWLVARAQPVGPTIAGAAHASFFFALFGLPVAYGVELAAGLLCYRTFQARGWLRPGPVAALAAAVGAIAMPVIWQSFWRESLSGVMALIGAVMGAAAGSVFAWVATGRSTSRPAS